MKAGLIFILTALWWVAAPLFAADADPTPPANRPNPEELRGRYRDLRPEEQDARLRALRSRLGAGTNRSEIEKRREEWRRLPPAEREARIREFREQNLNRGSSSSSRLTPTERETKRSEIKGRVDAQIKDLETRRSAAPLDPLERRRLERFQKMSRQLEQGTALGLPQRPGTENLPRRNTP